MKKQPKKKKTRSEKYDPKLKIDGSFEDVIGVSINYTPKEKETPKKATPKKTTKKK